MTSRDAGPGRSLRGPPIAGTGSPGRGRAGRRAGRSPAGRGCRERAPLPKRRAFRVFGKFDWEKKEKKKK